MKNDLKVSHWAHELSNAIPDKAVGISLAPLAGDDLFTSYVAEIPVGACVAAHYHPKGIEIYQILAGKGLMKIGSVTADQPVRWDQCREVTSGDFFTIHPGIVHQLENNSLERLILIVTCSPTNLSYNRIVTEQKVENAAR
ncbi:MAG: cupin domain-containing protein [Alphaproteobacteria bacterium]|nr:cupin domain-containing protein [Alphaproteobacteria bacterium]